MSNTHAGRLVIPFEELRMTDVEVVGGKNASLGELISQLSASGVQVPGGFATTADAFRDFLDHNRLTERINARLATLNTDDVKALAQAGDGKTPESAQAVAKVLMGSYGWGESEYSCLHSLWTRESSWNYQAKNPSSDAYGIPQSLPGDKMASVSSDWATNPVTQITWGLGYIAGRYGSPCGAWAHSEATGWY